jgi:hypothetical protein
MRKFVIFLFIIIASKNIFAKELEEPKSKAIPWEETIIAHPWFLTPILEVGPRSWQSGVRASWGSMSTLQSTAYPSTNWSLLGAQLAVVSENGSQRGYELFLIYSFGGTSHFGPLNLEIGYGLLSSGKGRDDPNHYAAPLIQLAYFFGRADGLQLGFVWKAPVSTSSKPYWFSDSTVSLRYSFNMGNTEKTKKMKREFELVD